MKYRKIGVYLRSATESPAQIAAQLKAIENFVDEQNRIHGNWDKVRIIYRDEGSSGRDPQRTVLRMMMRENRMGLTDLIIVSDLSRLSRNPSETCELLQALQQTNTTFISIHEKIDTSGACGKKFIMQPLLDAGSLPNGEIK